MKPLLKKRWIGCLTLMLLIGLTCARSEAAGQQGTGESPRAVAVLHPTVGHKAYGVVMFSKEPQGVLVIADLGGLRPGQHRLQIHTYGDCSALDAASAGGTFNPKQQPQAGPAKKKRILGELGSVEADSAGHARFAATVPLLSFSGPDSIIGRSVIVDGGGADSPVLTGGDGSSRDACGVIGIASK